LPNGQTTTSDDSNLLNSQRTFVALLLEAARCRACASHPNCQPITSVPNAEVRIPPEALILPTFNALMAFSCRFGRPRTLASAGAIPSSIFRWIGGPVLTRTNEKLAFSLTMRQETLAHVRESAGGIWLEHRLSDHLAGVSQLAAAFASSFGSGDWAEVAGVWHDLGKYSADFQRYIRNASGYERQEAHIEGGKGRVDHSTAGAIHAIDRFGVHGRILAYLIAGHHAGLPDWYPGEQSGPLAARLEQKELLERSKEGGTPPEILNQEETVHPPSWRP
jgi:CRISPR-associated endonuclease Cas3-HD